MSDFIKQILLEANKSLLSQYDIKVIMNYVDAHKVSNELLNITVPDNLKYSGVVRRLIKVTNTQLKEVLNGGVINNSKRSWASYSKTMKGLTEFYYNATTDLEGYDKCSIVIITKMQKKDCIIDVERFAKLYPKLFTGSFSNFMNEAEVIGKNLVPQITLKDLDAYCIKGKFTTVK